jgi:hypothetical protein
MIPMLTGSAWPYATSRRMSFKKGLNAIWFCALAHLGVRRRIFYKVPLCNQLRHEVVAGSAVIIAVQGAAKID